MTMRMTHGMRHKKHAWCESRRGTCKKSKRLSAGEGSDETPDINVKHQGRPHTSRASGSEVEGTAVGTFRQTGKRTNTAEFITRSSPLLVTTVQKCPVRRNSTVDLSQPVLLPPIKGSRLTPGGFLCVKTRVSAVEQEQPKALLEAKLSKASLDKENVQYRLHAYRQRDAPPLTRALYVYDTFTVTKVKECFNYEKSRSACAPKPPAFQQHLVASLSTPLPRSAEKGQRDEVHSSAADSGVRTDGVNATASSAETQPSKTLFSEDSAIESESQDVPEEESSESEQETHFSPEGDYYTKQRIVHWVLKVNASLFAPASEGQKQSSPGTEQDTAIKIVYEGD